MAATANRIERIEVEPGVRLAVEVPATSGKPVLMLSNSIGAGMGMWDEVVDRLSDQASIVRYDTRGHGQSDVPAGPYTIDRLGLDALAILDVLKIQRAVFCGLSLGGLTGMWLGVNRGERLAGLVLANTAAVLSLHDGSTYLDGVARAAKAIDDGAALDILEKYKALSA